MTQKTSLKPGRFVWHDLMTTDPQGSVDYYAKLFGWRSETMRVGDADDYTVLKADGRGIGGVVPMDESAGVPSHWIGYVTVENVDATVRAAIDLGGEAPVAGTDIPDVGRFAVIGGPRGAFVSPFEPSGEGDPELPTPPPPGLICWDQLMTGDPQIALSFYEQVFGWTALEKDMGEMGKYWVWRRGDANAAGMMAMPTGGAPSDFWLSYVEVEDVDATAARAGELGGQVLVPPGDIPDFARFAVTADPTGAMIAISKHVA